MAAGGQVDQAAVGEVREGDALGDEAPAEAEADGLGEAARGGDVVGGRVGVAVGDRAGEAALDDVFAVEADDGRGGERLGGVAVGEPPVPAVRRGDGEVAHRAEPGDPAALHGGALGGDRGHHGARPQQLGGVALVVGAQLEQHVGQVGQDRQEPARQRVGVHDDGHAGAGLPAQRAAGGGERLAFEQVDLAAQPHQRPACLRGLARPRPAHQHLADDLLQRLDALAHSRRRHVQDARRGVEAAVVDDRLEGRELHRVERHKAF